MRDIVIRQKTHLRMLVTLLFGVFIYALGAMVISREILIPRMLASTNGNIEGDPQYYHSLAIKKAAEIRSQGMAALEIRPEGQGPAGIASLAYLLCESPYSIVVINALLHSISTIAMVLIFQHWFSFRTSMIATVPLVVSPYMMFWFSQLNKDSFSLTGALLFVYGLLRITSSGRTAWNTVKGILPACIGILLMGLMRPYTNQMLMPITVLVLLLAVCAMLWNHSAIKEWVRLVVSGAIILFCLRLMSRGAASDATLDGFDHVGSLSADVSNNAVAAQAFASVDKSNWRDAPFLPACVNAKLRAVICQRCLMFTILATHDNPTTRYSFMDTDRIPGGSTATLAYLPRAALIGLFAPWPDRWSYVFTQRPSMFYTVVPLEAAAVYMGLAGVILWLRIHKRWGIMMPVAISFAMMTIYALAHPFLGVLYRYRYPWWILLLCLGLGAWISLVEQCQRRRIRQTS